MSKVKLRAGERIPTLDEIERIQDAILAFHRHDGRQAAFCREAHVSPNTLAKILHATPTRGAVIDKALAYVDLLHRNEAARQQHEAQAKEAAQLGLAADATSDEILIERGVQEMLATPALREVILAFGRDGERRLEGMTGIQFPAELFRKPDGSMNGTIGLFRPVYNRAKRLGVAEGISQLERMLAPLVVEVQGLRNEQRELLERPPLLQQLQRITAARRSANGGA